VLYGATMSDCAAERRQQLLAVCVGVAGSCH
jgi:hypothetical protein